MANTIPFTVPGPVRAVILAAGRGTRLQGANAEALPKCLLAPGGRSLLSRHLELLAECGAESADLVVGYEADAIVEHVGTLALRPPVAFHFNPRFELGSVISLLAARPTLESGQRIVLMDADVLYDPRIVHRLAAATADNVVLVDREFEAGEEPVKVALEAGRIVEFRKVLPAGLDYDFIGESVGFFALSPGTAAAAAEAAAHYEAEGLSDAPHEEVLRDLMLADPAAFHCEDVTGLPWIEIDFPEDLGRAEDVILPTIRQAFPGF